MRRTGEGESNNTQHEDMTMQVAIESLIIDGESVYDGTMGGMDKGEEGFRPPFALFSPDLQANVGGPYASYDHAEEAHAVMLKGGMVPYTNNEAFHGKWEDEYPDDTLARAALALAEPEKGSNDGKA